MPVPNNYARDVRHHSFTIAAYMREIEIEIERQRERERLANVIILDDSRRTFFLVYHSVADNCKLRTEVYHLDTDLSL